MPFRLLYIFGLFLCLSTTAQAQHGSSFTHLDTLTTEYSSDWNKRQVILRNDTVIKVISFHKDTVGMETFYEHGVVVKRIIYIKGAPVELKRGESGEKAVERPDLSEFDGHKYRKRKKE